MSVLDRLQFYLIDFMPYPDVVAGRLQGQWVDIPNTHFDAERGRQLYKNHLDHPILGDELGFDGLVVNEHHSTFYSLMPSCSIVAGALIARTKQAKICVFGNPITLTYPHRLAEEYAMLASGGRLECAFLLGTGMEYWVNPLNPSGARERFQESMDVLIRTASCLAADNAARVAANAVIVEEVVRLYWRLCKAKDAQISIGRIRAVTHHFRAEQGERKSIAPSSKLWTALHALNGYPIGESDWMVDYAARHCAGLTVETAITDETANFLMNRRMNKSQQMRWSRRGANLLLQVRCAVYNGALGSDRGQEFHPANDTHPHSQAIAA